MGVSSNLESRRAVFSFSYWNSIRADMLFYRSISNNIHGGP